MKVWDGTSVTRFCGAIRKAPDGEDWKRITLELQATQEFIANLASNTSEMPNLLKQIKEGQEKLEKLQAGLSIIALPNDVKTEVVKLRKEIIELRSIYKHAGEVLETVNLLQRQLLNLARRIDAHAEETEKVRLSFENKVGNWQRVNEQRWGDRLTEVENQLGTVSLALGIKKFGES